MSKQSMEKGTAFAYECKFEIYDKNTKIKKNKDGTISLIPPKKKPKK